MFRRPEFLALGYVCYDIRDEGPVVGGSAAYAALLARNLGYRAAIFTSATGDFPFESVIPSVGVYAQESSANTVFINRRLGSRRVQFVEAVARTLDLERLPPRWRRPKILYLCPILREFSAVEALSRVRAEVVGVAPQGWLRRRTPKGLVVKTAWDEFAEVAGRVDFVVASHEELTREEIRSYAELSRIFILTRGKAGADLYVQGVYWGRVPAAPATEVDETGAGDVFGAAFAVRYYETRDPVEAAYFAAAAASLAVEGVGLSGIPESREEVLSRLAALESSLERGEEVHDPFTNEINPSERDGRHQR
ncbi:PfkB family carbohydrate kinase [Candidatus Bipolaricaulota sp. J31]